MNGMKPTFDLADQYLESLDDAKKNGDALSAQTYVQNLEVLLDSLEQFGYDERRVELVERIREAIKGWSRPEVD